MSQYAFISPGSSYLLPQSFDFEEYIEIERELWALFPETDGKRVNFIQIGLTGNIYTEVSDDGSELRPEETYILTPCSDFTLKPLRMESCRRLTLGEYRMAHLTAIKLMDKVAQVSGVVREVGLEILGPEVVEEAEMRLRERYEEE